MSKGIDSSTAASQTAFALDPFYDVKDVSRLKAGVASQEGKAPDAPAAAIAFGAAMGLTASIVALMPKISGEDQAVLVAETFDKIKKAVSASNVETIKNKQQEKQAMLEKKMADDAEAARKIQEAIDSQKSSGIWGAIKCAFECLGAIIASIVAVAAIASGVGAPLGALLVAAAIVAIASAADSVTAQASPNHLGIAGSFRLMANGGDVEDARKADEGFGYAMMALGILLMFASLASAYRAGADAASKMTKTLQNMVKGDLAQAGAQAAQGGAAAAVAVSNRDAAEHQADAMKLKGLALKLEAEMKEIDASVDAQIAYLRHALDVFNKLMDSVSSAVEDEGMTAMHAVGSRA